MQLTYYGHSCFLLAAADGTTILIDPFNTEVGYPMPEVTPTAVTASHEHFDHNYVQMAKGKPKIIRGLAQEGKEWAKVDERVGQVRLTTVPTFHDASQGSERGRCAIFIFEVEGLRVVHLGDLGHTLDASQAKAISRPDVLMIPVGGHYTIGPAEADAVIASLNPRLVIPMHYKTEVNAGWPIGPLENFVSGKARVSRQANTVSIRSGDLPKDQSIWVFSHGGQ